MNQIFIQKTPYGLSTLPFSQRFLPWLVPLIVFLVALLPRIANLDIFLTADEDDQIMFASLFLKSALEGDPSNALVLGYPGIPTLFLGAIGVGLRYLFHYSGLLPLPWVTDDLMTTLEQTTLNFGTFEYTLDFIFWVRTPMAIATALSIMLIYLLVRQLVNEPLALLGTLIIAFDPFILAHSRVLHVDAPLAYFMFIAFLAFLLYLVEGRWRYLVTSGLFAGLAALSKTGPAIFLGPILVVSGLYYVLFYPLSGGQTRVLYSKRFLIALFGCGFTGMAAFFALWPTMWQQPTEAVGWIIKNLQSVNGTHHPTTGIFWGGGLTDQSPFYYLIVLPYHLTPLTTFGLLASLGLVAANGWARWRKTEHWLSRQLPLALSLVAYVVLFITPVSFVSRRGDRYILPVFFATGLLAALGLWWFANWLTRRLSREIILADNQILRQPRFWPAIQEIIDITPGRLIGGLILLQLIAVLSYHPYYLSYYNPLMGGGETAPYRLNVGWGEGLDEAARYLNEITRGRPHQVAAWYRNQFAPYYDGYTVDLSDQNAALFSDYTVFYLNQVQRGFPSKEIIEYFRQREPIQVINLGGVEYAWIYDGPVVSARPPESYNFAVGTLLGGGANLLGVDVAQTSLPTDAYVGDPQTMPTSSDTPPIFGEDVPGLPVTLYWETVSKIHGEHNIYIRLLDEAGNVWGQVDRLILAGLWRPDRWRQGFVIRDEYRLPIDPGTPPGTYHLEVGLYDFVTGQTYGIAKDIGDITLTPAKTVPQLPDLNLERQPLTAINDSLTLVGHTYTNTEVVPGAEIQGQIFWQANRPLEQDYQVQFWLSAPDLLSSSQLQTSMLRQAADFGVPDVNSTVTTDDRFIIHEASLLPAYPTSNWRHNELIGSAYQFRASAYAPAGDYPLMVTILDPTTGETIGEDVELAQVTVKPVKRNFTLPQDVTPLSAILNDEIELVGFRLHDETVPPREAFGLTLYWRGLRPAEANYTVFVHAIGPDQSLRGQWDSMPVQGHSPTSGWFPGEIIEDHYEVLMEKYAPAWKYDIFVGMYNADTGQRLPIYSAESPLSDNRVWLTRVQVVDDEAN